MIVGAFLTKIGFLLVILPILIFRHFKFNEILVFLLISLLLTTILLSGERMASLLFIMGITIYYLFKSILEFKKFYFLIFSFSIILLIFINSIMFQKI